jgi:CRISPR-associated protein Cas2
VFVDLPTETAEARRSYSRFRKFMDKSSFIMLQYLIYTKLESNKAVAKQIIYRLKQDQLKVGSVAVIEKTEKQFMEIEWILGSKQNKMLDTTERLTIYLTRRDYADSIPIRY